MPGLYVVRVRGGGVGADPQSPNPAVAAGSGHPAGRIIGLDRYGKGGLEYGRLKSPIVLAPRSGRLTNLANLPSGSYRGREPYLPR